MSESLVAGLWGFFFMLCSDLLTILNSKLIVYKSGPYSALWFHLNPCTCFTHSFNLSIFMNHTIFCLESKWAVMPLSTFLFTPSQTKHIAVCFHYRSIQIALQNSAGMFFVLPCWRESMVISAWNKDSTEEWSVAQCVIHFDSLSAKFNSLLLIDWNVAGHGLPKHCEFIS